MIDHGLVSLWLSILEFVCLWKCRGALRGGGLVTDGCWDEILFECRDEIMFQYMISSHQPKHDFISTAIRNKASSTLNCAAAPVPSANHALLNTHAQLRLTCARWHSHAHSYTETSSTRAWKDRWCMQTVQQFISVCPLCFIQVTILLLICQMLEMKNYFLVSSQQECSFDIH